VSAPGNTLPRPCAAAEAVERALRLLATKPVEPYVLGTGDFHPASTIDMPFSKNSFGYGCDCWGFAGSWCYQLPRHRPGFNKGPWATVADDVNCDSAIEQADHAAKLTDVVWSAVADAPRAGDLLVWPSIRDKHGARLRIGHVSIVLEVPAEWDWLHPQYGLCKVAQCAPGAPAIRASSGKSWEGRETFRGLTDVAWRTRILRVAP
jgi:hypothetical protein